MGGVSRWKVKKGRVFLLKLRV